MSQQLTGIAHFPQVIREMAADGTIHVGTDGLVRLGPHPARKTKLNGQQRWSEGRDPLPTPAPDVGADQTTREEEQREAGAPAASEDPEAVATPSPAGDAPDASADVESPPPAMGPAVASSEETNAMPESLETTLEQITRREAELRIDVDDFRCEIAGNGPAAWSAIAAVISALQGTKAVEQ